MADTHNLLGTHLALPTDNPLERMSILDIYVAVTGLSAVTHPRGSGHFMVRCPMQDHEDKHPSCILNQDTDSWKCFSRGESGGKLDLVIAAGLAKTPQAAAEFLRPRAGRSFQGAEQPAMKPNQVRGLLEKLDNEKLAGRYQYRDEKNTVLYECLRYEGKGKDGNRDKRFALRVPEPNGKWRSNISGVRRVPYRLPELIAARDKKSPQSVIVVEGEKHADALAALGFTVTTNVGGWGWEWPLPWAKFFAGAPRILLLPDADVSGRKAMKSRHTLLKGSGYNVVTVDLYPDRDDGSDVLDWMQENGFAKIPVAEQRKRLVDKFSGYCSVQKNA